MPRLIVRSVTGCHECSYDRSQDATIARTISRRMQRSIDRIIGHRPSRLIVQQSLIATTSRTISYYGSCHRYSPIVRDSATTRIDRSRYATAAGNRSKHCRSQPIVRSRNRTSRCECGFKSPAAIPALAVHQEWNLLDIALIRILNTNVCTYILANARLHACYLTGRTTIVVYMNVCCIVVKTIFE